MSSHALYRQYGRKALDAQYDNRARVPEHHGHSLRWAKESEELRRSARCQLDLSYGPTPSERLDVFMADEPGAAGLLWIHGGYWMSRDKADFSFMARPFIHAGVTVVPVNYALAPGVTVTEIVRQNRAAAAWLWRNAPRLGVSRERLYVSGHSAGGHLTVMLLETDWPAFGAGLPVQLFKGGAALSGIYDLEPIRLCYLNDTLHMGAAEAHTLSPLLNLVPETASPRAAVPLIAAVGGNESEEFLRQNAAMAAAWRGAGRPATEIVSPGKDHFTVLGQLTEPGNPLAEAMLRMMR
jgi:arylformamidase